MKAYAASDHTHEELTKLTITTPVNGLIVKNTSIPDLTVTGGSSTQQQVRVAGASNANGVRISGVDTWVTPSNAYVTSNITSSPHNIHVQHRISFLNKLLAALDI